MTPLKAPSSTTTHNPSHPATGPVSHLYIVSPLMIGAPLRCRGILFVCNPSSPPRVRSSQRGLYVAFWLSPLSKITTRHIPMAQPTTQHFGCLHLAKLQQGASPWPNQQLNMPIAAKPNQSMAQLSWLAVQPNQPTAHCHIANTILLLFLFLLQGHKNKLKFEEQVFESCTCLS